MQILIIIIIILTFTPSPQVEFSRSVLGDTLEDKLQEIY